MGNSSNNWLLRKSSGSRGKYSIKPDYADSRNSKNKHGTELPFRESIGKGWSHMDTGLVKRWLYSQVGRNFDQVYSDFLPRIQPKHLDRYRDSIFYYVNKKQEVKKIDGKVQVIGGMTFYIDPESNILKKYSEHSSRKDRSIYTDFGSFKYNHISRAFESEQHSSVEKISIKKAKNKFDCNTLKEYRTYLTAVYHLISLGKDKINKELSEYGLEKLQGNKRKSILLDFYSEQNPNLFHLYFEIHGEQAYLWKLWFYKFEINTVERISKDSIINPKQKR